MDKLWAGILYNQHVDNIWWT